MCRPDARSPPTPCPGRRACLQAIGALALGSVPGMVPTRARGENASITVTDALGRRVHLPAPPQRIVSIFASNTELLHALGATERIVGIEAFTRYPPDIHEGRVIVGGRLGFSAETIARLEPDLVIMTPARQAANTLLRPMEIIGVPVVVLLHRDLEQIFANLRLLGQVLGDPLHARAVILRLTRRLDRVASGLEGVHRPRVYVETGQNDRGNFSTLRRGTYSHDALHLAGGDNVFADLQNITQVSGEAVIAADPEVILVTRRDGDVGSVQRRTGWHRISAVRHGRVHAVPRELLLIPGPRIVDGVETMAALLHPQRMGNQASAHA
jgi:iron complex transport system substrate-binding protein